MVILSRFDGKPCSRCYTFVPRSHIGPCELSVAPMNLWDTVTEYMICCIKIWSNKYEKV
jgi:hypothetical protein